MSLRRVPVLTLIIAVAALLGGSLVQDAPAQAKKLKIGVIYDYTGPLAGGGSDLHALGAKIMIDYFAKKGGVEGYQIEALYADAQSKPEIAINEAVRLIEQEKVDMLLGFYSSAQCVPVAARVEQLKKFMWITTCISSAVLENRNLKYVFRSQPSGRQFGLMSTDFIAQNSKAKLKKDPKDLRVAIIHEDGAYGVDVSKGNEEGAKKAGFNIVLKEGYAATAPDLSPLVTKLKRARPDVIFHTGYNPDINLFLRQAKEQGLRVKAYVGHGAGHSQLDKLKEAFGKDVEFFHTLDPIASQLIAPAKLKPGVGDLTAEMVKRYKTLPGVDKDIADRAIAPHVSMGFNNMWILLNDVLPRAISKYGGFGPDALAKAARDTDIPEGGTMQGYGVKFYPPGHRFAGQNERSFPAVFEIIEDKFELVFPKTVATAQPILPLPASSPLAVR